MTIKYLTISRCITRWKFCSNALWITQTFIWTSQLKVYRSVLYPHDSYFVLQNTSFWYLKYLHHLVTVVEFICLTNNPSHHHLFIRIVSWFNYIPFHPCGRGSMEPWSSWSLMSSIRTATPEIAVIRVSMILWRMLGATLMPNWTLWTANRPRMVLIVCSCALVSSTSNWMNPETLTSVSSIVGNGYLSGMKA